MCTEKSEKKNKHQKVNTKNMQGLNVANYVAGKAQRRPVLVSLETAMTCSRSAHLQELLRLLSPPQSSCFTPPIYLKYANALRCIFQTKSSKYNYQLVVFNNRSTMHKVDDSLTSWMWGEKACANGRSHP